MVFISHTQDDNEYAQALKFILEKENISIFDASQNIKVGDNWVDKITESISLCDAFIFIISKSSKKSKWIDAEIILAVNKSLNENVALIPIVVDGINVPLYLETYQSLKIKDRNDLLMNAETITNAIHRYKNKNLISNELNYLNKEKELLDQIIKLEGAELKLRNKYQRLIFSISIPIIITIIIFSIILIEDINILNGLLTLSGVFTGIFSSFAIQKIKNIWEKKYDR